MVEIDNSNVKQIKSKNFSVLPIFVILIVLFIALFIGEFLFGKNSFSVYKDLKKDKIILAQKINNLKNENAKLQKDYFELKGLLPSKEEDE